MSAAKHSHGPAANDADVREMVKSWKGQTGEHGPRTPASELPLAALLLSGLTHGADEGPAADVLTSVIETVEGWVRAMPDGETVAHVPPGDLMLLQRRLEVALELLRRGAGAWK